MEVFILSSHLLPANNLILVELLIKPKLLLHVLRVRELLETNSERFHVPHFFFFFGRQYLVLNYLARKLQVVVRLLRSPRVRSIPIIQLLNVMILPLRLEISILLRISNGHLLLWTLIFVEIKLVENFLRNVFILIVEGIVRIFIFKLLLGNLSVPISSIERHI